MCEGILTPYCDLDLHNFQLFGSLWSASKGICFSLAQVEAIRHSSWARIDLAWNQQTNKRIEFRLRKSTRNPSQILFRFAWGTLRSAPLNVKLRLSSCNLCDVGDVEQEKEIDHHRGIMLLKISEWENHSVYIKHFTVNRLLMDGNLVQCWKQQLFGPRFRQDVFILL